MPRDDDEDKGQHRQDDGQQHHSQHQFLVIFLQEIHVVRENESYLPVGGVVSGLEASGLIGGVPPPPAGCLTAGATKAGFGSFESSLMTSNVIVILRSFSSNTIVGPFGAVAAAAAEAETDGAEGRACANPY